MNEFDKIQELITFLNEVKPLVEEMEAARLVKTEDPERWWASKNAFEDKRRYWRQIAEYVASGAAQVAAPVANAKAAPFAPVTPEEK